MACPRRCPLPLITPVLTAGRPVRITGYSGALHLLRDSPARCPVPGTPTETSALGNHHRVVVSLPSFTREVQLSEFYVSSAASRQVEAAGIGVQGRLLGHGQEWTLGIMTCRAQPPAPTPGSHLPKDPCWPHAAWPWAAPRGTKIPGGQGRGGSPPSTSRGTGQAGGLCPEAAPPSPRSGAHSSACQGAVPSPPVGRHRGHGLEDPRPTPNPGADSPSPSPKPVPFGKSRCHDVGPGLNP